MTPATVRELSDTIASANGPLRILGGGTRQALGECCLGAPLGTANLSGITLYEPEALTLVAQAGTPMAELQAVLRSENQQFAFEPMDHRQILGSGGNPTLGGVVACNVSGPRRLSAGACRDSLLGVSLVDGRGNIIKNGGRVMKNVTGYDLVKLMAGSYGTLGVLTELSFRVLPIPEASATLCLHQLSVGQASAVMARAIGSANEISGATYFDHTVHLRIEGLEASVAHRLGVLKDLFHEHEISVETAPDAHAEIWRGIRDVTPLCEKRGNIWRLHIKPSDAPEVMNRLSAAEIRYDSMLDWGGGLIWLCLSRDFDLRKSLEGIAGHASLIRGSGFAAVPPTSNAVARLSAGLRGKFDPRGILNAGILG
ncbi:2-hydroxy-acid oxidase [Amylibacter marinus]|uniref:2-hydroxy-acid oxidase n=1 Tax=Amylibacter marinus TaxID=1475483 RepID=A0ABQ5VV67_9RHOB|nr:FAD-binding protein [Amylibacter marinus]GLQ35220.1 2-hydroxy-acid oxidase [Amylibacter marinus]